MKSIYIFFLSLLFLSGFSQSTTDDRIMDFFRIYEQSSSEAIDDLFEDNHWLQDQFEDVLNLKYQLHETQKLLGEYRGFEKISERNVGESMRQVVCMVKYDRQPLRFRFHFYKPKDAWIPLNFYFDDDFSEEF